MSRVYLSFGSVEEYIQVLTFGLTSFNRSPTHLQNNSRKKFTSKITSNVQSMTLYKY